MPVLTQKMENFLEISFLQVFLYNYNEERINYIDSVLTCILMCSATDIQT